MSAHTILQNAANEGHVNLQVEMAAVYPVGTLTYISGDYAVTAISTTDNKAFAGVVVTPPPAAAGNGVIASRFRQVLEDVVAGGAINAGALVKTAADSGGVQRVAAWVSGSDTPDEIIGMALEAASGAGETIDIGLF